MSIEAPEEGPAAGTTGRLRVALIGSRGIPARYSGFETFYEQLAVRLAARGHAVTVYNRTHHVRHPDREYRGVRLVHLPALRTKHLETLSHTALSLLHAIATGYDIHYVSIVGNSPLLLLTRALGRISVLNVDGADYRREKWGWLASRYLRWCERIACRLADAVIADSRAIQSRYRRQHGASTKFIPYGANLEPREGNEDTRALLARFGLEPDGYVLFVGRLTPENGAHVLIEAFKSARTRLKLVIVGDAPYMGAYKRRLQAACDARVVMTGYRFGDEYRRLSHGCRYFVLPSAVDGTRPVLLDQMGFGNCVAVRDSPSNVEVVGDSGIVFSGADPVVALREVIETLEDDDDTVQAMRARALDRVRRHYRWDDVVDRYEALFTDLVRARRRDGG